MTIRESAKSSFQDLIKFLDSNKISYKGNTEKTSIEVYNTIPGYEKVIYDAWDFYLVSKVTEKLNSKLDYSIINEKGKTRVAVTTKANYDLKKAISSFNTDMIQTKMPHILSVFLGENLNQNSKEMCLCTMIPSGTYCSVEYTRTEVLFALVYNLPIELHKEGYYYFPSLRILYDAYTSGKDAF